MKVNIFDTDNTYSIVYADPPWSYGGGKNKETFQGLASVHYGTMKTKEICSLPIDRITKDSVLFLWATAPQLEEAFKVIKAWGFTYKTVGFTWIKKTKTGKNFFGLGFWTRSNAEYCLIATKGKKHPKRIDSTISMIVESVIEQHSKKPDEVRSKIVQLIGDLPRIELFAREQANGWDCWGNEV